MSYLKTVAIDTLPLPSNPDFHVRMRARATWGIERKIQEAMVSVDEIQPGSPITPRMKVEGAATTLMLALLVDWNLTDENDQPLPLTAENLDELAPEDGQFIAAEAGKRLALRGVAQEKLFATPS